MQPINLGQMAPAAQAVVRNDAENEDNLCPILQIPIENRVVTPCNHAFEASGIFQWVEAKHDNATCPVCRAPFKAVQLKAEGHAPAAAAVNNVAPSVIANTQNEVSDDYEMPRLVQRERAQGSDAERDALVAGLAMFIMAIVAVVGSIVQWFINHNHNRRIEHSFSHFQQNPAFSINHLSHSVFVNE